MTSSSTTTPPLDLTVRLARTQPVVAVALLFAVNGLIIGGYGGVLPSIRERLDLSATDVATLLFGAGIVAMQIAGRRCDAIGARQVALAGLPLLIAAAITFASATTFPVAVTGAALLGLGNFAQGWGVVTTLGTPHSGHVAVGTLMTRRRAGRP
jgi:MFS family permease